MEAVHSELERQADALVEAGGRGLGDARVVEAHRELVGGGPAAMFDRQRRYEPTCSGVVLYLGLDRPYRHLSHHNFVFSRDPGEEFDAIYRRGEPAPDPTCYLCAPARTDLTVAPGGGEALALRIGWAYEQATTWRERHPPEV